MFDHMPRARDNNGANISPDADRAEREVSELDDVKESVMDGFWDPISMAGGYAADDSAVIRHPAYLKPTKYQGTTSEEMGF